MVQDPPPLSGVKLALGEPYCRLVADEDSSDVTVLRLDEPRPSLAHDVNRATRGGIWLIESSCPRGCGGIWVHAERSAFRVYAVPTTSGWAQPF